VQGDISLALVSNYMFDWDFFPLRCCPGLLQAKQVGEWGAPLLCLFDWDIFV
jgi:hypothetical protein